VQAGLPSFVEARDLRRQLHASHPEKGEYARELGDALLRLGVLLRHAGDWPAAQEAFAEARSAVESIAGPAEDEPARQAWLAAAMTRQAESLADLDQTEKALELLARAVGVWTSLVSVSPSAPLAREGQSESLWEQARILRNKGRGTDADRLDADRQALWKGQSPSGLIMLAGEEMSRATVIGYGKTPLTPQGESVRKLELDEAAAHLRLALSLGYRDLAALRADSRLAPLLARDDLKTILENLGKADRTPASNPQ
jgi:tetratricopeptide (TPR) repeat protein